MLDLEKSKKFMNLKFENFVDTLQGEDILAKTDRLDEVLSSGIMTGNEALGMVTMNKVSPESDIREKDGKIHNVIMLGSNSYLNLSTHPQVMDGARQALEEFGYGMGAVSNYAGITDIHKELEGRIAEFYGVEDSIVFPSGYGANVGIVSALCSKNDVVINDAANHASIFDGCMLSGADIKVYPHKDMRYLERILSRLPEEKTGRLIITDGVFSMDGDMAPLDKIVELAQKYRCRVMVDDAHGLGVIGNGGRGTADYFGLTDKVDIIMGTFSKSLASLGGYMAGDKRVVNYVRHASRPFIFCASIPPANCATAIEALHILRSHPEMPKRLVELAAYMRKGLLERGIAIRDSITPIIPIYTYDEMRTLRKAKELFDAGVYVNPVLPPATPPGESLLRTSYMANHTETILDEALDIIERIVKND